MVESDMKWHDIMCNINAACWNWNVFFYRCVFFLWKKSAISATIQEGSYSLEIHWLQTQNSCITHIFYGTPLIYLQWQYNSNGVFQWSLQWAKITWWFPAFLRMFCTLSIFQFFSLDLLDLNFFLSDPICFILTKIFLKMSPKTGLFSHLSCQWFRIQLKKNCKLQNC